MFLDLLPVTQGAVTFVAIRPSVVYPGNVFISGWMSQSSYSGIAVHVGLYHSFWVNITSWSMNILIALATILETRVVLYSITVISSTNLVRTEASTTISNCIQWITFSSSFHLSDGIEEPTTDINWREKEQNWWNGLTEHVLVCSTPVRFTSSRFCHKECKHEQQDTDLHLEKTVKTRIPSAEKISFYTTKLGKFILCTSREFANG